MDKNGIKISSRIWFNKHENKLIVLLFSVVFSLYRGRIVTKHLLLYPTFTLFALQVYKQFKRSTQEKLVKDLS